MLSCTLTVSLVDLLIFVIDRPRHLEPSTIELFGAAVLMLLQNIEHHNEKAKQNVKVIETFNEVDWFTIFFFVGLFIVAHGFDAAGAIGVLSRRFWAATGGDFATTAYAILWGSAVLSSIVDNIPFVATMIPLIKATAPTFGADHLQP